MNSRQRRKAEAEVHNQKLNAKSISDALLENAVRLAAKILDVKNIKANGIMYEGRPYSATGELQDE